MWYRERERERGEGKGEKEGRGRENGEEHILIWLVEMGGSVDAMSRGIHHLMHLQAYFMSFLKRNSDCYIFSHPILFL